MRSINRMNKSELLNTLNKVAKLQQKLLNKIARDPEENESHEEAGDHRFEAKQKLQIAKMMLEHAKKDGDEESIKDAENEIHYWESKL